ncbi:methionyl-tRNA formyltransferase, putative [Plasmodium sp. gorilla clade G2]|uniref:methionyl-tRNA formyltransferase, putative n=1 Tax=Plasmodium sp. gorilla clade G2 TaxID=880535 RepID=UPI000D21A835|nr:methionyl-tRNA formyltransferase, putative [Plasmodium sp. gorilla clade G2]SOV17540.1 methionyl-tRNA formyltransferase, putative [Plasmodium sp. gorilla clade G2]
MYIKCFFYVIQILFIIFLKCHGYKIKCFNILDFSKKNYYSFRENINCELIKNNVNKNNLSNVLLRRRKKKNALAKELYVSTFKDNYKTHTNFIRTNIFLEEDKQIQQCNINNIINNNVDIQRNDEKNKILNKYQMDDINILYILLLNTSIIYKKKYDFFMNKKYIRYYYDIYKNNLERDKKIYNIKKYFINKFSISWYNTIKPYMNNIFLEILNIIENTLGNKIFYIDIKQELSKNKDEIINTLYDIYKTNFTKCDKKPIKLLFIGSNEYSNLCFKIILLIIKRLRNDIILDNVITKSPRRKGRNLILKKSNVEDEAIKNNINVFYYDKLKNNIHMLQNKEIDLCISISFGEIFNCNFFKTIKSNIFSLHPSLLPFYKGASPIQRSLLNNEILYGYTVFLTTLNIDSGNVIMKKPFWFDSNYNFNDIITILFTQGTLSLIKNISYLANYNKDISDTHIYNNNIYEETNNLNPSHGQNKNDNEINIHNSNLDNKNNSRNNILPCNINNVQNNYNNKMYIQNDYNINNNYAPKIKNDEKYICFFCSTSLFIHNKVRSFINWPKAECTLFLLQNEVIKPLEVKIIKSSYDLNNNYKFIKYDKLINTHHHHTCFDNIPRNFVYIQNDSLNILCKNNTLLKIYKLQQKNKKIVDALSFINSINKCSLLY